MTSNAGDSPEPSICLRHQHIPFADLRRCLTKLDPNFESSELGIQFIKMSKQYSSQSIDFSTEWQHSDIKFVVEGKPLFASKLILTLWSPVFKAMFENNFKEKNAIEIALPGKKYSDIIELLSVTHPPNQEISGDNVVQLLPLLQEYQLDSLVERAEEVLCNQPSSVKNFVLAQKFGLQHLHESTLSYLKRAPIVRLKSQPDFDQLDQQFLVELLTEKLEKFETNVDSLREVRMVLERKKPTTFPGMHLLCDACTGAREQQVDCTGCMKNCCLKLTSILRNMEA